MGEILLIDAWKYMLPEIMLTFFATAILIAKAYGFPPRFGDRRKIYFWTAMAPIAFSLAAIVAQWNEVGDYDSSAFFLFGGTNLGLSVDKFALLFKILFLVIVFLVFISARWDLEMEKHQAEFYALIMFSTVGLMIVAMADDLFLLWIGIEIAAFTATPLAGFRKQERRSTEAGLKFFVTSAVATAVTLYGISLVYGVAGSTNFDRIVLGFETTPLGFTGLMGAVMLVGGLGFKISAVPFHMWTPDVYEGSPISFTVFLASASKKMGFAAVFKIFLVGLIVTKMDWEIAIAVLAILTMTIGNIMAIAQKRVTRMLAFSSVAQAGYIMIAIPIGTEFALAAAIFHIFAHSIMTAGAFFVVFALGELGFDDRLEDFRGLAQRSGFLAGMMMIFMLSLAGIPPLMGFFSKFFLFGSAIEIGGWYIVLAIAGILNSALSLVYYLRVIKYMFVFSPSGEKLMEPMPTRHLILLLYPAVFLFIFGIFPHLLFDLCVDAAAALLS